MFNPNHSGGLLRLRTGGGYWNYVILNKCKTYVTTYQKPNLLVEVLENLVDWDNEFTYERLGLEEGRVVVLGVELPEVYIPLFPGKNITVIAETIAMDYLLRLDGQHSAQEFNQRLNDKIKQNKDSNTK